MDENKTKNEELNEEAEVIEEVSEETAPEKNESDELKDKLMRTMAEFDNYKKRTQKEKDSLYQFTVGETVGKFLPVLDTLKLSLNHDGDENFKKGVELTIKQFEETLSKLGVSEISSVGEIFDPNLHNAVMHIEDENYKENEIVEVLQTGYKLNDNVIRFAMVKVAN